MKLDFIEGADAPAEVVSDAPAETAAEVVTPEASPPELAAVAAPDAAAPAKDQPASTGHVPIAALLDERDRRQAAERRAQELESRVAPPAAPQVPDLYDDPEGYAAWQQSQMQMALLDTRLNVQEEAVRERVGDEAVNEAVAWLTDKVKTNPSYYAEVMGQKNPFAFLVQQHQRAKSVEGLDESELGKFRAWQAAQASIATPAPTATLTPAPSAPPPPRSIVSMPSAAGAGHVETGAGVAFDKTFKD